MPNFKSIPLIFLVIAAISQSAAHASSVDIQSGGTRVSIDRNGQVYIRDNGRYDDSYSDLDDRDWNRTRANPYSKRYYRRGLSRDRYYRARCRSHNTSYGGYGSSTSSSTTICN